MERYKCTVHPLRAPGHDALVNVANKYIQKWEQKCSPQKLHVWASFFGKKTMVLMEDCIDHFYNKCVDPNSPVTVVVDIAGRLSLMPCVEEILEKTTYNPEEIEEEGQKKWVLEGRLLQKRRDDPVKVVKVVLFKNNNQQWYVKTYHPYTVPSKKKKPVRT